MKSSSPQQDAVVVALTRDFVAIHSTTESSCHNSIGYTKSIFTPKIIFKKYGLFLLKLNNLQLRYLP